MFIDADQFDPDMYDPDNFVAKPARAQAVPGVRAVQSEQASIDLTFSNPTAGAITFELFAFLDSFTRRRKTEYINPALAAYTYHPLMTREGLEAYLNSNAIADGGGGAAAAITAGEKGYVGFDSTGALIITGGSADPIAKLSCAQFPYSGLFESSAHTPMKIKRIRLTVANDSQIDQEIIHFHRSFLGGEKVNRVTPRTYFDPSQFQNKIIDVPADLLVDAEKGIRYTLNAGETVKWSLSVNRWVKKTLG